MANDDRVATLFLILSMLLHLALLLPLPALQLHKVPQSEEQPRATYIVRMPQSARTPTPIASPSMPEPLPRSETPPVAAVEPRTAQLFERSQLRPEATPAPQLSSPPIKVVDPDRADRPLPRRPTTLKPHTTPMRHQKIPPLPQVAQTSVKPIREEAVKRPMPRQPSTLGQEAVMPRPPVRAAEELNPLTAYLAEIRAAIERHKRYPAVARRAGMAGHVVLQFILLADGRVIDPRVVENEGHTAFATAALESLRRAGQMPPFPDTLEQERLMVQVPIAYRLME
jgi:protein TonB